MYILMGFHGCVCLLYSPLPHPCPLSEFLFVSRPRANVTCFARPAWLLNPPPPAAQLISPSFQLPVDLTHSSFVVDDGLRATCVFCFKYLSIVLNSESLEGRDCILFNFISKLLT